MDAIDIMWIGMGGGTGALIRWRIGLWIGQRYQGALPLGTLLINVSGALLLGYLTILFSIDWRDRYGAALNASVLTGMLGGYTTFSSMQLDALQLFNKRRRTLALGYLLLSVLAGLAAVMAGAWLAHSQPSLELW